MPNQMIGSETISPAQGPEMPMSNNCLRSARDPSMPITAPIVPVISTGTGMKERQAGRDMIADGLHEVSHLVGQKNADDRGHIDQPGGPVGRDGPGRRLVHQETRRVPIEGAGDERRETGGHE